MADEAKPLCSSSIVRRSSGLITAWAKRFGSMRARDLLTSLPAIAFWRLLAISMLGKAPRVPISGLNIAAAFPSMEIAKSLQKAMAGSDVSRSLARIDPKRFAHAVMSPELRRTMEELHKGFASSAMKEVVKTLGSPQMEAIRKQQAEIARVAKSPAMD